MHARVSEQASPLQAAKAYRLFRVILNTAVEDERITHNPCKLRGAGVEVSPERPFVDADLVLALAAAIDERYSCLVLLAGFGGLGSASCSRSAASTSTWSATPSPSPCRP